MFKQRLATTAMLCLTAMNFAVPAFSQSTSEIAKGNCRSASAACQKAAEYCTEKKGKFAQASTTNALKDCIDACKAASSFLERGSQLGTKAAALAYEACNECAKACDQYKDDPQMVSCANECRKAASNLQKVK